MDEKLSDVTVAMLDKFQRDHPELAEWCAKRFGPQVEKIRASIKDGKKLHDVIFSATDMEQVSACLVETNLSPEVIYALVRESRFDGAPEAISKQNSRAGKHKRNRPSPYAGEFPQWRIKAAAELALHDDADVKALAAAIKKGTHTKAADRYLRAWVSTNLAAITKQAERAKASVVRA